MASVKHIGSILERAFQKWDYQRAIDLSENESQTRDYLIEPFFNLLGYNKMDHYSHEFSLKFSGNVKKVDMVITLDGKTPIMLVECKKSNSNLTPKHFNQLAEYYKNHRESKLAILTNGIVYKFYSVKWNDDKTLNEEPFMVFDLNDFTRADIEDIAQFHIKMFNINKIKETAEEKYFLEDFDKALVKTLHRPGKKITKLIFDNMGGGGRMTDKVSGRIYDLINSLSLQEAVEKVKVLEGKDSKSGVYTTSSEMNAFQIIKTILALSPKLKNHVERVNHKDYKGHFKIIVDNMPSKEICYLVLSDNIKKIGFGNDSFILGKVSATEIAKHKKRLVEEALKYLY